MENRAHHSERGNRTVGYVFGVENVCDRSRTDALVLHPDPFDFIGHQNIIVVSGHVELLWGPQNKTKFAPLFGFGDHLQNTTVQGNNPLKKRSGRKKKKCLDVAICTMHTCAMLSPSPVPPAFCSSPFFVIG